MKLSEHFRAKEANKMLPQRKRKKIDTVTAPVCLWHNNNNSPTLAFCHQRNKGCKSTHNKSHQKHSPLTINTFLFVSLQSVKQPEAFLHPVSLNVSSLIWSLEEKYSLITFIMVDSLVNKWAVKDTSTQTTNQRRTEAPLIKRMRPELNRCQ